MVKVKMTWLQVAAIVSLVAVEAAFLPSRDWLLSEGSDSAALERSSSPLCKTFASGILSTSNKKVPNAFDPKPTTKPKRVPFHLNQNNEIAYYGPNSTKPTIFAQFQTCTPNWKGSPNDGTYDTEGDFAEERMQYFGRVYIPATKMCIGVENLATGPDSQNSVYYPKVVPCLRSADGEMGTNKSAPQNFGFSTHDPTTQGSAATPGKYLYWYGYTRGTDPNKWTRGCQGGGGIFGYNQVFASDNTPDVYENNRIGYRCNSGFEVAVAAAELV